MGDRTHLPAPEGCELCFYFFEGTCVSPLFTQVQYQQDMCPTGNTTMTSKIFQFQRHIPAPFCLLPMRKGTHKQTYVKMLGVVSGT